MNKNFEHIKLTENSTLKDAMKIIDSGAMRIAVVVKEDNYLIGVLTDGDIRRGLLDGLELNDKIDSIINKTPVTCDANEEKEKVISTAINNKLHQVPIITSDNILIRIEEMGGLLKPAKYDNVVVLMIGGLGSRLMPLTKDTPKPMLHVGKQPILETIINSFKKYGFTNFLLSVSYKADVIEEYFGNGSKFGVNIEYIHELERKGTAGALSLMRDKLDGDFFVMNGDLLTRTNFEHLLSYHQSQKSVATMGVRRYDFEVPYGVVKMDGCNILKIEEKPTHKLFVNAGIYMLNSNILDNVPDGEFYDMPTLFSKLIEENANVNSFPIREYWIDIGHIDELNRANKEYSEFFNGT